MKKVKVSVIIPAYNKADLTVKAVESVMQQTYSNIEIIVVDDGSTDHTKEKLKCFSEKIRYIHKENGGACSARNLGIREASGDYIALLDCDDIYYPKKIEISVFCLESDPDYGFISTAAYKIDEDGTIISEFLGAEQPPSGWILSRLVIRNQIINSTVLVKKACFKQVGYFDEKIFIPADYDMWTRLAEKFKAGYVKEKLTGYRISDDFTIANVEQSLNEELYLVNKKTEMGHLSSNRLKNRCYFNVYYYHAKMFAANGNKSKAVDYFLKAVKHDAFNRKIFFIITAMVLSYVWPQKLQEFLRIKMIHTTNPNVE